MRTWVALWTVWTEVELVTAWPWIVGCRFTSVKCVSRLCRPYLTLDLQTGPSRLHSQPKTTRWFWTGPERRKTKVFYCSG